MSAIAGVGLDLVDVDRFAGVLARRGQAVEQRLYRAGEIRPGLAGRARAAHLAGLFAAKEAALKALGTGWAQGLGFRDVEVVRDERGRPSLRLHGAAAARAADLGVVDSHLSISHDHGVAAAMVVLERGG